MVPATFAWRNYLDGWALAPFAALYKNSLMVTVLGALIQICVAVLSSYAFAFLRFPGKNVVFMIFLGAMMVPGTVVLMPNYLTIASLGWVNTYAGLDHPACRFGVRDVPAPPAHVDPAGGGDRRRRRSTAPDTCAILWSVVLPMSRPMVVTVVVMALVEKWNDFVWPLVVHEHGLDAYPAGRDAHAQRTRRASRTGAR